jgi:hypothetical protein
MAISGGFWPLNLSVESLVLREIVPTTSHRLEQGASWRGPVAYGIPWPIPRVTCRYKVQIQMQMGE